MQTRFANLFRVLSASFIQVKRPSGPFFAVSQCRCLAASRVKFSARKFTEDHEWIAVQDNVGTVGISDYAQDLLGEIVFVDLPSVGEEVEIQDRVGAIESVKAASEIYSPVSGKIAEVNAALEEKPSLVNESPLDEGWLLKIDMSKADQLDALMSESQYSEFVKGLQSDAQE